jgi:hypothetical protein
MDPRLFFSPQGNHDGFPTPAAKGSRPGRRLRGGPDILRAQGWENNRVMGIKTIGWDHKNPSDSSFVRISVIFVLIGCFVLGLDESINQRGPGFLIGFMI